MRRVSDVSEGRARSRLRLGRLTAFASRVGPSNVAKPMDRSGSMAIELNKLRLFISLAILFCIPA